MERGATSAQSWTNAARRRVAGQGQDWVGAEGLKNDAAETGAGAVGALIGPDWGLARPAAAAASRQPGSSAREVSLGHPAIGLAFVRHRELRDVPERDRLALDEADSVRTGGRQRNGRSAETGRDPDRTSQINEC